MLYDRPTGDTLSLDFPPLHEEASRVRRSVMAELVGRGLGSELIADVELIIAELTSNAVDQQPDGDVKLKVIVGEDLVAISIANRCGQGRELRLDHGPGDEPDPLADRGRGLAIVEALADELSAENVDGWMTLTCVRRFG